MLVRKIFFRETFDDDLVAIRSFYAKIIGSVDILDWFLAALFEEIIQTAQLPATGVRRVLDDREFRTFLIFKNKFIVFYEDLPGGGRAITYIRHQKQDNL